MTIEPMYPITEAEEQELMDHEESYSSQYESLAEWNNEVAQFGDAGFQKPEIKALTYPPRLQALKDKLDRYWAEVDLLKNERHAQGIINDDEIPF